MGEDRTEVARAAAEAVHIQVSHAEDPVNTWDNPDYWFVTLFSLEFLFSNAIAFVGFLRTHPTLQVTLIFPRLHIG